MIDDVLIKNVKFGPAVFYETKFLATQDSNLKKDQFGPIFL